MLIRSQCKKKLINFSNYHGVVISYRSDCDFCVCAWCEMPSQEVAQVEMGNYSSEGKAIKVLNEIQCQYARFSCRYGSDCSDDAVYNMPQDSEV